MLLDERMRALPDNARVGSITVWFDRVYFSVDTIGLLKEADRTHRFEASGAFPVAKGGGDKAVLQALDAMYLAAPELSALEVAAPGPFSSLKECDRASGSPEYGRFLGVGRGDGLGGVDPYRLVQQFWQDKASLPGAPSRLPDIALSRDVQSGAAGESFVDRFEVDPVFGRVLPTVLVKLCYQSDVSAPHLDGFRLSPPFDAAGAELQLFYQCNDLPEQFGGAFANPGNVPTEFLTFDGATSLRAIYELRRMQNEPKHSISEIPSSCDSFTVVAEYTGQMLSRLWDSFGPVRFRLLGSVVTGSGGNHTKEFLRTVRESFDFYFHTSVRDPLETPRMNLVIQERQHPLPVSLGAALRASRFLVHS